MSPQPVRASSSTAEPAAPADASNADGTAETTTTTTTTAAAAAAAAAAAETDRLTSCLGCRKRKLKCSRDVPSCTHCQRLDVTCVYDAKKSKPGLRPGAIEALSQRIEALENALAKRHDTASPPRVLAPSSNGAGIASSAAAAAADASPSVVNILAILAQELQKLNTLSSVPSADPHTARQQVVTTTNGINGTNGNGTSGTAVSSPSTSSSPPSSSHGHGPPPRKRRRRIDSCGNPNIDLSRPFEDLVDHADLSAAPRLPPPDVLQAIVNAYFFAVQPWIPALHETQFRRRMHDADQRPQLTCILHAMVVAAGRYVQDVQDIDSSVDAAALLRYAQRSRSHVVLAAMDSLSVENLQALIIIAFHDIGSGNSARAWSIVASLTRTMEYLRLGVEDESNQQQQYHDDKAAAPPQPLLRPLTLLQPPRNWVEEEERRRVFWCIFLLDRFCCVATGWDTAIAAADVQRRLPADGFFFHKEEPVLTPYMYPPPPPAGSPDGIGHGHAHAHAHAHAAGNNAREPVDSPASTHSHSHSHGPSPVQIGNMANVGAFGYCIEAAESLSRVTTYFLLQRVDFSNRQDVSRWLTRFKELDLRLVHWKMYLPQRWKDSNVSRQPALVNMDPNLTLAHITHNTSTILLHQRIAYPDAAWTRIVKLPSFCSAETCQNAAVETATIANKYLRYTDNHGPVTSQFAFCVYISARVLLVHWRSEAAEEKNTNSNSNRSAPDILPEFWSLLRSLEDMDRRWIGTGHDTNASGSSLAGHYARHLKELHRQCLASPTFVVDVLDYTAFEPVTQPPASMSMSWHADLAAASTIPPPPPSAEAVPQPFPQPIPQSQMQSQPQPQSQPPPPPPPPPPQSQWTMQPMEQLSPMTAYQQHQAVASPSAAYAAAAAASVAGVPTGATMPTDDLAAISHLLLDQQFMDRDRVISFEDSFFAAPGRWS